MQPFIRNWLREDRPKQYCTFVGSRSMLRHTWDRAVTMAPARQVVTVLGAGHRGYLDAAPAPGSLLEQPRDCGTAPGVFLPLALVASRDPEATVLLLPADHFVFPEAAFAQQTKTACRYASELPERVVLLGARARWPEPEFGWIAAGALARGFPLRRVEEFFEKPRRDTAERLHAEGALWSTMVVAARLDSLWQLGERHLPAMMERFTALRDELAALGPEAPALRQTEAIARAYRSMPTADFSRDLIQRSPGLCLVLTLEGVEWCDWGRPERIAETLDRLGRPPAFATGLVTENALVATRVTDRVTGRPSRQPVKLA